jgi:hypothetical protein
VGSTFSIDIAVNLTDSPITSGAVDIGWTPGVLNLDSVVLGSALTVFTSTGTIDNLAGTVMNIQGGNFGSLPSIFTMATLNFTYQGINNAMAMIDVIGLDGTFAGTWTIGGITPAVFDPHSGATVSAVPVPPALVLFASAIAGLGVSRRRKV